MSRDNGSALGGHDVKVDEGESIKLDGRGSTDPDGRIVAYDWSRKGRLDDPTKARPTFTALDDGDFEIELSVTDDRGASDTGRARIVVRNVDPRLAEIEPQSILVGEQLRLDAIRFRDPGSDDRHEVTIDWGDGATTTATLSDDGSAQADHAYAEVGDYRAGVTVRDDDGGSASTRFTVTVEGEAGA